MSTEMVMSYRAHVLEFLIASPSDVSAEREIVRQVIANWNAVYSRQEHLVAMPVGWETHSSPELSGRPQQMINDRILIHADILVGIFWTRIGSSTGKHVSGTVEEIKEHHKAGKPAMLYFSNSPISPDAIDHKQYEKLQEFKEWARPKGLYETYNSTQEFSQKLRDHIPIVMRNNDYISAIASEARSLSDESAFEPTMQPVVQTPLSVDALELLTAAAADVHGIIERQQTLAGVQIKVAQVNLASGIGRRSAARWEAALEQLIRLKLVVDSVGRGATFEVTDAGYRRLNGHK